MEDRAEGTARGAAGERGGMGATCGAVGMRDGAAAERDAGVLDGGVPGLLTGANAASDTGAGAPCEVILLHGFGQSARTWDEVVALLGERGVATRALDWPGFGARRGCRDAQVFSLEGMGSLLADEVRASAARTGAAPVVVGYSMGGRVALEALVRGLIAPSWRRGGERASSGVTEGAPRPAGVVGLVLEGAGLGPADAAARATLAGRNAAWAADVRERGVAAFMDDWARLPLFASQRALPPDVRARLAEGRAANDAEALALSLEGVGAHRQADEARSLAALAAAAEVGLPVLYVAGELDAKYAAVAARAAEAGCATRVVSGAGHSVHLERPVAFADAVAALAWTKNRDLAGF